MFTYEFRFIVDNLDDIALLCGGDNASAELFTKYLHLFPTSLRRCVDRVRHARVRLYSRIFKQLLERTEDPLIVRGDHFVIVIFRSQNLHFVVTGEYLRRRLAKLVTEKLQNSLVQRVTQKRILSVLKINFIYEL